VRHQVFDEEDGAGPLATAHRLTCVDAASHGVPQRPPELGRVAVHSFSVGEAGEPLLDLPCPEQAVARLAKCQLVVDHVDVPREPLVDAVEREHLGRLQEPIGVHRHAVSQRPARLVDARHAPQIVARLADAGERLDVVPLEHEPGRRHVVRRQLVAERLDDQRRHRDRGHEPRPPHPGCHPGQDPVRQAVGRGGETQRVDAAFALGFGIEEGAVGDQHPIDLVGKRSVGPGARLWWWSSTSNFNARWTRSTSRRPTGLTVAAHLGQDSNIAGRSDSRNFDCSCTRPSVTVSS
jgi:hypothetical protein